MLPWHDVAKKEKTMTALIQTDFLAVARAAFARGFPAVTPLKDKQPFTHEWNTLWALRNDFDIERAAQFYPHNDCGLVMHRERDKPFAWDIDKKGVLERMKAETGHTLPETYIVQTRPETAPHKRHVFMLHTDRTVSELHKNVNAGDYDLIGTSDRPLQVVAEGCVRTDTGEIRTGNGKRSVPAPDWWVTWIIEDIKRLRAAHRRQNADDAVEMASLSINGGMIPKGKRKKWLRWLAKWLVTFRMQRKDVLAEITRQCRLYCEDGVAYSEGTDKKTLRDIAYDKTLRPSDPTQWLQEEKTAKIGTVITSYLNPRQTRLLAISKFPNSINPTDASRRLGVAGKKAENVLTRDMPAGGFDYDPTSNLWVRGGTQ